MKKILSLVLSLMLLLSMAAVPAAADDLFSFFAQPEPAPAPEAPVQLDLFGAAVDTVPKSVAPAPSAAVPKAGDG